MNKLITFALCAAAACGSKKDGPPPHEAATADTEDMLSDLRPVGTTLSFTGEVLHSGDPLCDSLQLGFKDLLEVHERFEAMPATHPGVGACVDRARAAMSTAEAVIVNGITAGDCDALSAFWTEHGGEIRQALCAGRAAYNDCVADAAAAKATTVMSKLDNANHDWDDCPGAKDEAPAVATDTAPSGAAPPAAPPAPR